MVKALQSLRRLRSKTRDTLLDNRNYRIPFFQVVGCETQDPHNLVESSAWRKCAPDWPAKFSQCFLKRHYLSRDLRPIPDGRSSNLVIWWNPIVQWCVSLVFELSQNSLSDEDYGEGTKYIIVVESLLILSKCMRAWRVFSILSKTGVLAILVGYWAQRAYVY